MKKRIIIRGVEFVLPYNTKQEKDFCIEMEKTEKKSIEYEIKTNNLME